MHWYTYCMLPSDNRSERYKEIEKEKLTNYYSPAVTLPPGDDAASLG